MNHNTRSMNGEYVVYCILSENKLGARTYIGITNNLGKRLDQHNGLRAGGAKSTRAATAPWTLLHLVSGFGSKSDALKFEYAWKHGTSRLRSPESKNEILYKLLQDLAWSHLRVE